MWYVKVNNNRKCYYPERSILYKSNLYALNMNVPGEQLKFSQKKVDELKGFVSKQETW